MNRSSFGYLVAATGVLVTGLLAHKLRTMFPGMGYKIAGDALWAALIYLMFALLLPRASIRAIAGYASLFSAVIEFSQLFHAPWIDTLRATLPGKLILGSVFSVWDFAYYGIGILGCVVTELGIVANQRKRPSLG